jgi:glutamine synthetase
MTDRRMTDENIMTTQFEAWIKEHGTGEVECLVPDMNGIIRGKVLPAAKFLQTARDDSLRIPTSVYLVTVTGEYPEDEDDATADLDPDVTLRADFNTLCVAPGFKTPTAFVIADAYDKDGNALQISPRYILQKVIALYEAKGWRPVVAPELEFYLTQINQDPDIPLSPPLGRSGRPESAPQPYGLEAITEYEDLIEDIYSFAETASLEIDTMIHEAGAAQLEINFNHGSPLKLADQVLLFKRLVRQVALNHGVYATFMAKPMEHQPGSAMHLHQSVVDTETGRNLFADAEGDTDMFRHYVGGLQTLLPQVMPLFAPNVNSFRRMRPSHSAPINVQWGYDNRTCGLRVPISDSQSRRVENRLPGADSNPYLMIASSLICGYVGMVEKIEPTEMVTGTAYDYARTLPRTLEEALDRFNGCTVVRQLLGETFCRAFSLIKGAELDAFQGVISSWERDHLLLKV